MQHATFISRRNFLQKTAMLATATGLGRIGMLNARAQTTPPAGPSDYKALVCVFLLGGNDGHNMIIPTSGQAATNYRTFRGSLSIPDNNTTVLPVTAKNGAGYALNSGLASLHPLWAQGKMAVVANMGMLVKPLNRDDYMQSKITVPTNLFSHSDQMVSMQAGEPFGSSGSGWAGRIADATRAMNAAATFPPAISFAGSALFCSGNIVQSTSLIPGYNLAGDGLAAWPASAANAKAQALQEIIQLNSGVSMIQSANDVRADAVELNGMLTGLSGGEDYDSKSFPGSNIGKQLQQVAQIISLRASTGMRRQVFFCAINGFDTHSGQSWQQMDLLRDMSDAVFAFHNAMGKMNLADKVTTFTASEFGRSLQPSGTGSDHGWGNHQIVVGGAVKGGDVYGTFPSLLLNGLDTTGNRGVLIPTTALDQFGATLASWFGVSDTDMASVFPHLANFGTANLGFVG